MTKLPQVGEWWETRGGDRRLVLAINPHAGAYPMIVVDDVEMLNIHDLEGRYRCDCESDGDLVRHLPDCDSFEWVEPAKPVVPDPGDGWRLIDKEVDTPQEGDELWKVSLWGPRVSPACMQFGYGFYRRRVTPAESPDDWVEITDPEHVLRAGVDQCKPNDCEHVPWFPVSGMAGDSVQNVLYAYKVRCRRKDLPVVVKRIPVRLFYYMNSNGTFEDCVVFASGSVPPLHRRCRELHGDGSGGWYVSGDG